MNSLPSTDSLSARASLTFLSSGLHQIARVVVTLVLTPFIVSGLGSATYGLWAILRQLVGYLGLSDLSPMSAVKFLLGIEQHSEDLDRKKRIISSSLILWILTLPLFLSFGGVTLYFLPEVFGSDYLEGGVLEWTLGILLAGVILDRIVSLPANILRAQNIEFKAMGLQAGIVLVNGLLCILAIELGYGLIGLAGATVLGSFILGLLRFWIVRKHLQWVGWAKPERKEFWSFFKANAWIFVGSLCGLLLSATDLLLVGFLAGSEQAAVYAITYAALQLSLAPLTQLLGAANPGLVGLCGEGAWARVQGVWVELHKLTLLSVVSMGLGVILFNELFVSLWVGADLFGGVALSTVFALLFFVIMLTRVDTIILNAELRFFERIRAQLLSAVLGVSLTLLIVENTGALIAVPVGFLAAHVLLKAILLFEISRATELSISDYLAALTRTVIVGIVLLIASAWLVTLFPVDSLELIAVRGGLLFFVFLGLFWRFGLYSPDREQIGARFRSFLRLTPRATSPSQ